MEAPILYGPGFSTYVRTARLALEEKGIDYTLEEFNFIEAMPAEQVARHPFSKVPAFEHDGFGLYETFAICRYVDEAFEGPRLQPDDLHRRARMTQIFGILDNYTYGPVVSTIVIQRMVVPMLGEVPDEEAIAAAVPGARKAMEVLEKLLGDQRFLTGDAPSLADLHLVPVLTYFSGTPEGGSVLAETPGLRRWLDGMRARDSVTRTEPSFD